MFLAAVYALTQSRRWIWILREPVMWVILAVCIIPLVNEIWMEGMGFYRHRGVMKWILVLFPCFVFSLPNERSSIRIVHTLFLLAMAVSTGYSLWHYVADFASMAARYKMSKVMPTLAFGDHIRIGWLTVVSCVIAWFEFKNNQNRVLVGLLVLLMPLISYYTIPSLRERFHFIKYDFEHYIRGEYREGLSDAVRLYSLQAGWGAVRQCPYTGVGFSKLQDFCNNWYKENVPDLKADNYFLPSSEVVIYWASGGLTGLAVILTYLIFPLVFRLFWSNAWWLTFYLPACLTLMYETHLEGQLPLFAWSFFFAWFWKLAINDHIEKGLKNK